MDNIVWLTRNVSATQAIEQLFLGIIVMDYGGTI